MTMTMTRRHCLFTWVLRAIPIVLPLSWGAVYSFGWHDWPLLVSFTGVLLSLAFFVQRQRLKEIELFKELFTDFNQRYDELNGELNAIVEGSGELCSSEKHLLYDYFNLCAEQYLFYQAGYIRSDVWGAWTSGMKTYYENDRIGELWSDELESPSYYNFPEEVLKVT